MQFPSCRTQRNLGMACDAIKKPKYATRTHNRFYPCVRCVFRRFSCACIACVAVFMLLAIRFAFVCLSVCPSVRPSVAYIANNSRTRRLRVPKFGMKVPHLWCDSHTSFKVKKSKIKVTRPINADTHRATYLSNGKAYELQTWYTDGGRRPASPTGAMTFKVKVARSRDQSEPSWPNAVGYVCHYWPSGAYRVGRTGRPHLFDLGWSTSHNLRALRPYASLEIDL